jgi:hypothetical protein
MFSISFTDAGDISHSLIDGTLVLGASTESFQASTDYWKPSDYQSQWQKALEQITGGRNKAALVTSLGDPAYANFITWWPMWRFGNTVRIREQMLFLEELQEKFDEHRLSDYVSEFYDDTADETKVSTWTVSLSEIIEFLTE